MQLPANICKFIGNTIIYPLYDVSFYAEIKAEIKATKACQYCTMALKILYWDIFSCAGNVHTKFLTILFLPPS